MKIEIMMMIFKLE